MLEFVFLKNRFNCALSTILQCILCEQKNNKTHFYVILFISN